MRPLVLLLALAPTLVTGTVEEECAPCGGTGRVACAKHRSADLALETGGVILCTFYAGCASCAGRGTVDCAACDAVEDEATVERRAARAKRFAEYDAALGRPLLAAASAHFDLVCALEPMKAQKKRRNPHELLHLHLERLEDVHRAYLDLFALEESAITTRSEVFLWTELADHKKAGAAFCTYEPDDPAYYRGLDARFSLCLDARRMPDDEALHHNLVHHAIHGLMNAQEPLGFTGQLRMGWADEGLSLWFEDRLLGAARGYCFYPEEELKGLRGGRWRPAIARVLAAHEPLDLEAFLQKDTVDMTREEHALGFALIDWLAAQDPALLDQLLRRLRARTPARDAFQEVYGLSLDDVDAAWRAWMAETYPKR